MFFDIHRRGLVGDKVIIVLAGWILIVLTLLLAFSASTTKDDHALQSRMTSLQAMFCFGDAEHFTMPSHR